MASPSASTVRAPFNAMDQLIFDLDGELDPWSVHLEVCVPGRLDPERLAGAASQATMRHPMMRARLARFRDYDRRCSWEIADEPAHVPLEVVNAGDDGAADAARGALLSRRVGLGAAPPLALVHVRGADGDRLIMNLNHVAADGMSALRIMTSIARAYAGADDPLPPVDPVEARRLRRLAGDRSPLGSIMRLVELAERSSVDRSHGRPARVAVDGGEPAASGYGFHLLALSEEETAAVVAARIEPATVNDVLLAALAIAVRRFNDAHAVEARRISILMPVNLRPPAWSTEVVSNLVSYASISVAPGAQDELASAQRAVARRTRRVKERQGAGAMIDLLEVAGASAVPIGIRQVAARGLASALVDRELDTVVLSNLGRLRAPLDFGDAGRAGELWFSPPASMPLGLATGAATIGDRLHLTIRYCRAQCDARAAASFAGIWRSVLLGDRQPA